MEEVAVSFIVKENGDTGVQFGHLTKKLDDVVRTHSTLVSKEVFKILRDGTMEEVKKEINYQLNK